MSACGYLPDRPLRRLTRRAGWGDTSRGRPDGIQSPSGKGCASSGLREAPLGPGVRALSPTPVYGRLLPRYPVFVGRPRLQEGGYVQPGPKKRSSFRWYFVGMAITVISVAIVIFAI